MKRTASSSKVLNLLLVWANSLYSDDRTQVIEAVGFSPEDAKNAEKILVITFSNKNYATASRETLIQSAKALLDAFRWLGFFDENQKITPGKTFLEVYCSLLEPKLAFKVFVTQTRSPLL